MHSGQVLVSTSLIPIIFDTNVLTSLDHNEASPSSTVYAKLCRSLVQSCVRGGVVEVPGICRPHLGQPFQPSGFREAPVTQQASQIGSGSVWVSVLNCAHQNVVHQQTDLAEYRTWMEWGCGGGEGELHDSRRQPGSE